MTDTARVAADWDRSADAWIDVIGADGDWGRRHVLDAPMLARVSGRGFCDAIDIGCGEGRFCRMMQAEGLRTTGIDPTARLIDQARRRDPAGDYRVERAEALSVADASVDLAVAYLSLIDIPDIVAAIAEARRVLRPGGSFLIANLQGFNSAAVHQGWHRGPLGGLSFPIDHYLEERTVSVAWAGIRIVNHHRPLSTYMSALLGAGFELRHFAEPAPYAVPVEDDVPGGKADRYRRVPNFLIMEWQRAA